MTDPSPEILRQSKLRGTCTQQLLDAAADAWERALKIVEARPSDPYPDEDMDLSPEAHEWVQEIWRMARIHQAEAIRLRKRLEEAERACRHAVEYHRTYVDESGVVCISLQSYALIKAVDLAALAPDAPKEA